ncbi:MAG: Glutaryl-7-aminocephalosporanic-acid acylase [Bacteroidia bacterium]|nr:Glutaryl-7-aminocephalosporanic-acid acylase [Bacteroidia bacterium]
MLRIVILLLLIAQSVCCYAQINPANITIARDSFGVPHIYGHTDAEAAYGLAYAHCEDDFKSIQQNLLAAKGMLGEVLGKEGVLFDFGLQFFGIDTLVDNNYERLISADFKKVLEGYIQGVNDFAAAHPDQVLLPKALPFKPTDMVKGSTLTLTLFAGAGMALKSIKDNHIELLHQPNEIGSNSLAIAPSRTDDGKTWLLVNSHQPIEGRFAWYEAHIKSDEGWDVIGGLFPGGTTIFLGSNQKLGWAHTTNYHTFGDIYKLKHKGNKYRYDGKWKTFQTKKAHLKLKLGKLKIGITKKIRTCEYGPVFQTKHGWYAIRYPGAMDLRATEQWFRMNKANNFREFENALKMEAIPLFNIMYADVDGTIFYQSGCQVPLRDSTLNWNLPITANTSNYKWNSLVPYNQKPSLLNPSCGYLFSCNQTQYSVSGKECSWNGSFIGIQQFNYNRGERFGEMLAAVKDKFTWTDFLNVKFDKSYSQKGSYARNFKAAFQLDEHKYTDIADAIKKLKQWNWTGDTENKDAALAMIMQERLQKKWKVPFAFLMIKKEPLHEDELADALRYTKKFMLKKYGTLDVKLGDVQRLIRGNVSFPASGMREVSRAADPKLFDKTKGIWRITNGDGYIQVNKYSHSGVEINSVNAYGASSHPDSKHYTDQMELFSKEQFKTMTFNWDEILKNAEKIYHP